MDKVRKAWEEIFTDERLVPEKTITHDKDGKFYDAPVIRVVTHPPGTHPKSPIVNELTAVEMVTPIRSRWHGTVKAWIGSDLRMHMLINPKDEVLRNWELPDTE